MLVGDFNQLAPVSEEHIDFVSLEALKDICEYRCELKINKRVDDPSDKIFFDVMGQAIEGTQITHKFEKPRELLDLNLACTNRTRKRVNRVCMLKFRPEDKEEYFKLPETNRIKHYPEKGPPHWQATWIYKGLPLRCRHNIKHKNGNIHSGDTFRVVEFDEQTISLRRDSDEVGFDLPRTDSFVYSFNPSYCMTVHASQGQTFARPYCLWETEMYDRKMLYTALSRSTKLENIHVS